MTEMQKVWPSSKFKLPRRCKQRSLFSLTLPFDQKKNGGRELFLRFDAAVPSSAPVER